MDIETAIRAIENISGFDDETTGVGEAWAFVLATIARLTAERDAAVRERDELREVAAMLGPFTTKDGVRVKNGDVLYWLPYGQVSETKPVQFMVKVPAWNPDAGMCSGRDGYINLQVSNCYSTREAALAARPSSEEGGG